MKKLIALFLAVVMILGVMPTVSFAASEIILTPAKAKDLQNGARIGTSEGLIVQVDSSAIWEVDFPETGNYIINEITLGYAASSSDGPAAQISIDGVAVGTFKYDGGIIPTGSINHTVEIKMPFTAEAGLRKLKFKNISANPALGIKSITIKYLGSGADVDFSKTEGAYKKHFIPTKIEAEDFDRGATGYYSIDGINDGKKYREEDPVNIFLDALTQEFYVKLEAGERTTYTFTAQQSDAYILNIASKTSGSAKLYFDGNPTALPVSVKGGADFTETEAANLYIEKGEHKVTVEAVSALEFNCLQFVTSTKDGYVTLDNIDELAKRNEELANAPHPIYKEIYLSPDGNDANAGDEANPFKTLARAKDEIAKINDNMTGDIIVNFAPGYYHIAETMAFTKEHEGKNGFDIIFRGLGDGKDKPIIGGGTKITGWEQTETPEIYKASTNIEDTRALYVNGYMARRAQSKYIYEGIEEFALPGSEYSTDGFTVSKHNFPELKNPEDVELKWRMLWVLQRTPVKEIIDTGDTWTFIMDQPYWEWSHTSTAHTNVYVNYSPKGTQSAKRTFTIENDISLLDQPGEFYFDKATKEIYYYPYYEEDMETAEVYAPTTEILMTFTGENVNSRMTNLKFENLSFRHGSWNELSKTGKRTGQADKYVNGKNQLSEPSGMAMVPAQIQFKYADGIDFTDCEITNMGSNGISMVDSVSNVNFVGNVFHDLSGTGLVIGHWDIRTSVGSSVKPSNFNIKNNYFTRCSAELTDTTCIAVYLADNVSMTYNTFLDVAYSAITVGWGWGVYFGTDTGCYNFDVSYNRFERVMQITSDGGAYYSLANMFNTTVTNNYINQANHGNGGIYFDNGTSFASAYDNVVLNVPRWYRKNTPGQECYVGGNFTNDLPNASEDAYHTTNGTIFLENTYMPSDDLTNYPKAQAIKENAGLTDEYKHLEFDYQLPEWMPITWEWEPLHRFVGSNSWSDTTMYVDFYDPDGALPGVYGFSLAEYMNYIGNTSRTEWQEYDLEVYADGEYTIRMLAGQPAERTDETAARARIWCDGEVVAEAIAPRVKVNDYITAEFEVGKVTLTKGIHRFRVEQHVNNMMVGPIMLDDGTVKTDNDYNYEEGKVVERKPGRPVRLTAEDISILTGNAEHLRKEVEYVFDDIKGHWAADNIQKMAKIGIIKGVSETEFAPESKVTLHQAIWLALRAAGIEYTDANWKKLATDMGLLKNANEADKPISRERFADVTIKAYTKAKGSYTATFGDNMFPDSASISAEYMNSVMGAKYMGFMTGSDGGKFNPKSTLTRAEAATVVQRLYAKTL